MNHRLLHKIMVCGKLCTYSLHIIPQICISISHYKCLLKFTIIRIVIEDKGEVYIIFVFYDMQAFWTRCLYLASINTTKSLPCISIFSLSTVILLTHSRTLCFLSTFLWFFGDKNVILKKINDKWRKWNIPEYSDTYIMYWFQHSETPNAIFWQLYVIKGWFLFSNMLNVYTERVNS